MSTSVQSIPPQALAISRRLTEALAPEQVFLFGSHARGDAGPDSDLDFLVVVSQSQETRYERAVAARRAIRGIAVPADVIVLTRAEWENDLTVVCSLASTVLREGIVLHAE